jgi:hypothetical protein
MPWFDRDALRPMGVPLDGSVAGLVFRRKQPLVIQDTRADIRHFKSVDRVTKHQTNSLAAVPLIVRGEVVGVLEALNKRDDAHYTEEDLTILETLGALAAQAMKNVGLERKVRAARIEVAEFERLKTDFIAITSHELRTPLGLILGHATFLRELAGDEFSAQLDTIVKNASRLKEIIENLSSVDNVRSGAARIRNNKMSLSEHSSYNSFRKSSGSYSIKSSSSRRAIKVYTSLLLLFFKIVYFSFLSLVVMMRRINCTYQRSKCTPRKTNVLAFFTVSCMACGNSLFPIIPERY